MDTLTLTLAKKYTDAAALNGVSVNYPRIDPVTKHWGVFNTASNAYVDTGITAEGVDGVTPRIGANGRWFFGDVDTGVKAVGVDGESAYEIALRGGFTGTEDEWLASLAADTLLLAHNTDPSGDQHPAIREMITSLPSLKDASYNASTGDVVLTKRDNSTVSFNILVDSLARDLDFDPATNKLIITKADGSSVQIDVSALVDVYRGSDEAQIQITIGSGNVITAVLKSGSVTKQHLTNDVQTSLGKADTAIQGGSQFATAAQGAKADNAVPSTALGGSGLSSLQTVNKTLVPAINEVNNRVGVIVSDNEYHESSGNCIYTHPLFCMIRFRMENIGGSQGNLQISYTGNSSENIVKPMRHNGVYTFLNDCSTLFGKYPTEDLDLQYPAGWKVYIKWYKFVS